MLDRKLYIFLQEMSFICPFLCSAPLLLKLVFLLQRADKESEGAGKMLQQLGKQGMLSLKTNLSFSR